MRFLFFFFICMTPTLISTTVLASSPKETIKAYTDALTTADLDKAYSMVCENDKPYFSKTEHMQFHCKKFDDEACSLLLNKTKFRILSVQTKDNITAKARVEKNVPQYSLLVKVLFENHFAKLRELYNNRNDKEKDMAFRAEMRNKLIDGLKNDKFPMHSTKTTYRLLNENGEWKIYFDKKVPKFLIEARNHTEKKGREITEKFLDYILTNDFEAAHKLLSENDQKKYTPDDLKEKMEFSDIEEEDDDEQRETTATITEGFGSPDNSRQWSFTCKFVFPKNKKGYHPVKNLIVDIALSKEDNPYIIFDSIRLKKK